MKILLIEVIVIMVVGLLSIAEGIRLVVGEKIQLYDVLGPGFYNAGIGLILTILGILYFISQRGKNLNEKKKGTSREYRVKMLSMIVIMAVYIALIDLVGYFFASIPFFLMINKVAGLRSWLTVVIVSLAMTISFYIIFVTWMGTVFPRGVLLSL
jgi:hypothetical protein